MGTEGEGKSIWSLVEKTTFHSRVRDLNDRGNIASTIAGSTAKITSPIHLLDFYNEHRLANDIAFVAACQPAGEHVIASAIEATNSNQTGVKVCLAANRGISEAVEIAMKSLFGCLERRAIKGCALHAYMLIAASSFSTYRQFLDISRELCREGAFDIIVRSNMNRILGRLRSKRFSIPSGWAPASKKPLTSRWQTHISKQMQNTRRSRSQPIKTFSAEINELHFIFLQIEENPTDDPFPYIKKLIKMAYALTWGGQVLLIDRLAALNFPESFMDRRDVRELYKVANYWRICCSLEDLCSSPAFGAHFQNIELEVIRPYTSTIPTAIEGEALRVHIHAEIQMLVHYELTGKTITWPQVVGTSKNACFLCNAFFRAHGAFHSTDTHGLTFWQWTVPELNEYSAETVSTLQAALELLDLAVKEEHERELGSPEDRQDPAHSSIDLRLPQLLTPISGESAAQ